MGLKVIKNKENPESPEILAEAIIKISEGFEQLVSQKFTENGIVSLIHALPGMSVSKRDIQSVLHGLKTLKGYYLRKV